MGVPESRRTLSRYEFQAQATAIRTEVITLASGPLIPKSQRFLIAIPMCDTARLLVEHLTRAAAYWPNSQENAGMRRKYMTEAVADCELLMQDLQTAGMTCDRIKPSRVARLTAMLDREIALIKGARKNIRVIGSKE